MKAYWDSLTKEQQGELAGKVGSTPGYLRLVFNGYKKASFVLAKKLEQCTSGAITKSDLRPDIAADAKAIAFGNFKRGYTIVDRIGTRILRDPYTNKPFVGFYTTKRTGGMLVDSQAIKLLKIAAA